MRFLIVYNLYTNYIKFYSPNCEHLVIFLNRIISANVIKETEESLVTNQTVSYEYQYFMPLDKQTTTILFFVNIFINVYLYQHIATIPNNIWPFINIWYLYLLVYVYFHILLRNIKETRQNWNGDHLKRAHLKTGHSLRMKSISEVSALIITSR